MTRPVFFDEKPECICRGSIELKAESIELSMKMGCQQKWGNKNTNQKFYKNKSIYFFFAFKRINNYRKLDD